MNLVAYVLKKDFQCHDGRAGGRVEHLIGRPIIWATHQLKHDYCYIKLNVNYNLNSEMGVCGGG